jgi:hypothetical protein
MRTLEEDLQVGRLEPGKAAPERDSSGEGAEVVRGGEAERVEDGGENPEGRYLPCEINDRNEKIWFHFPRWRCRAHPLVEGRWIAAGEVEERTSAEVLDKIFVTEL